MKIPRVRINDEKDERFFPTQTEKWKEIMKVMHIPEYLYPLDMNCRCFTPADMRREIKGATIGQIILDEHIDPKPQKRVYFSNDNPPKEGQMVYIDEDICGIFIGGMLDSSTDTYKVIHDCGDGSIDIKFGNDHWYVNISSLYILEGYEPERIYFSDDNLPKVGDMVYYDSTKRFDSHESFLTDGGRYKYCEYKYSDIGYLENDDGNKSTAWFENCYILSNEVKWGVEKFEVGKWYVCRLKDGKEVSGWIDKMEKWFDGKPRKCTYFSSEHSIKFEGIKDGSRSYWGDLEYFREVPEP